MYKIETRMDVEIDNPTDKEVDEQIDKLRNGQTNIRKIIDKQTFTTTCTRKFC